MNMNMFKKIMVGLLVVGVTSSACVEAMHKKQMVMKRFTQGTFDEKDLDELLENKHDFDEKQLNEIQDKMLKTVVVAEPAQPLSWKKIILRTAVGGSIGYVLVNDGLMQCIFKGNISACAALIPVAGFAVLASLAVVAYKKRQAIDLGIRGAFTAGLRKLRLA